MGSRQHNARGYPESLGKPRPLHNLLEHTLTLRISASKLIMSGIDGRRCARLLVGLLAQPESLDSTQHVEAALVYYLDD